MTKHELSQLYFLSRVIVKEQEHLQQLKSMATKTTISYHQTHGGVGRYSDPTALGADIADCESKLHDLQRARSRVIKYISSIPDLYTRTIFELRYISGYSWVSIASYLGGNNTADGVRMHANRYHGFYNENLKKH